MSRRQRGKPRESANDASRDKASQRCCEGESGTVERALLDHLEAWSDHLRAVRGRAAGTVKRYRGAVEACLLNLGVRHATELEAVDFSGLDRHLRALHLAGRARSTLAGVVAALRSFFEYSALVGVTEENPALRLRGPSTSYQAEAPYLEESEARRLIFGERLGWLPGEWLAARNQVLIAVSWAAGLRVSEPAALRLDDLRVDEDGTWSILVRAAKWSESDTRIAIRDPRVGRMLGEDRVDQRHELALAALVGRQLQHDRRLDIHPTPTKVLQNAFSAWNECGSSAWFSSDLPACSISRFDITSMTSSVVPFLQESAWPRTYSTISGMLPATIWRE